MSNVAPFQLNFAPGVTIGGVVYDLTVYCGSDWALSIPFYASDGVTPVNVSGAQMQIKSTEDSSSMVLVVPTVSTSTNVISISIPGSATKKLNATRGYYDVTVIRADTGGSVRVAEGVVVFDPATTTLT